MCIKDILQLSSEDLNQSMSPHKISYHYISSVTVSSSNTHPVYESWMLPSHVVLGHFDPWRWDRLVILKRWNGITTSCCTQFQKKGLKNVQFLCPSIRRMQNGEYINIYICSVTLLQKMSNGIKSHDLPHQAIGPSLSTQHCCSSFKSFYNSKNHHKWGFHFLKPHKQNPHTEINILAVTAKIISQPSRQLFVASVAAQSWQTDFHWLHERLLCLVQHSCLIRKQITLWFTRDEENIPVTLWCSKPVTQPANV